MNCRYRLQTVLPDWPSRGLSNYPQCTGCLRLSLQQDKTNGFFVACFEKHNDKLPQLEVHHVLKSEQSMKHQEIKHPCNRQATLSANSLKIKKVKKRFGIVSKMSETETMRSEFVKKQQAVKQRHVVQSNSSRKKKNKQRKKPITN